MPIIVNVLVEVYSKLPLYSSKNNLIGDLRSGAYSPQFDKVVGIAMINKGYWDKKTPIKLKLDGKQSKAMLCDLPIVNTK